MVAENRTNLIGNANVGGEAAANRPKHAGPTAVQLVIQSRPFSLFLAVVVFLAAVSVFLNSMYTGLVNKALDGQIDLHQQPAVQVPPRAPDIATAAAAIEPTPVDTFFDAGAIIRPSLMAVLVFMLHLTYLGIVAWEQIYKRPVRDREWQNVLLLLMLAAVYALPAVMYMTNFAYISIKIVSISSFASLYFAWGLLDFWELRKAEKNKLRHRLSAAQLLQKQLWMYLDFGLGLLLGAALLTYWWPWTAQHGGKALFYFNWLDGLTLKELAVATTIGAFFAVKKLIRSYSRASEVLSHKLWQDAIQQDAEHLPTLHIDAIVPVGRPLRILVVNCGTGKRTRQLLRTMHKGGLPLLGRNEMHARRKHESRFVLYGYNHDDRADGSGDIEHSHFTSDPRRAGEWAREADIICILHSTYDREETRRVREVLEDNLNANGCLILARGFADHSYLATICYQLIDRGFVVTPHYHEWNTKHLAELAKDLEFQPVDPKRSSTDSLFHDEPPTPDDEMVGGFARLESVLPCAIIPQHFLVSSFTIACIQDYLARQFDPVRADLVERQLRMLAATTDDPRNLKRLNADDYVYAFYFSGNKPPAPDHARHVSMTDWDTGPLERPRTAAIRADD